MAEETKHTPEPWRLYRRGVSVPGYDVCDRIVSDHMNGRIASQDGLSEADAARIVACANACAGLPNAALESGVVGEMPGIIRDLLAANGSGPKSCGHEFHCVCPYDRARALLSRLPPSGGER